MCMPPNNQDQEVATDNQDQEVATVVQEFATVIDNQDQGEEVAVPRHSTHRHKNPPNYWSKE